MNAARRYLATFLTIPLLVGCWLIFAARPFGAANPGAVFLPFDLRYNGMLKLNSVQQSRPDVLWIGSSRAATLREQMFQPYRFYNMSFTGWTTEQIADAFERATRDWSPRVVVISLDYFLFTDEWARAYAGTRAMVYDREWDYLRSSIADFLKAAMKSPQLLNEILLGQGNFVGTHAILSREGFRRDGSYLFSLKHIDDARLHHQTAQTLVSAVPGAPNMSDQQKASIVRIAELAKQRRIQLIGVQLPFIRPAVDYLDHDASYTYYSGVWREFESEQNRSWLEGLGIAFFDLGHSTINDDSRNFVDAYHVSELGALRVMQQLLSYSKFRAALPDIDPVEINRQVDQFDAQSQSNS
ncbi:MULTISPECIES: hydrolase [unclassified Bradyrhizobium]|uniref:hydrolase n=1 Tax=unclassified Bradyrhizobium TaxID=2631580 RepID=UPI002915F7CC|nr:MULTISPECIES: hydrolase [unclassified Bradyrhizobium]